MPYKQLMQERMCEALEIYCDFYPTTEPFRGVYQVDESYPFQFVAHIGRGPMTPSHMYYLTFNPKDIWNGFLPINHCTPVMVATELAELTPIHSKVFTPGTINAVRGEFGEVWTFFANLSNSDDPTGCMLRVRVYFKGKEISYYFITLDHVLSRMLGRMGVFV